MHIISYACIFIFVQFAVIGATIDDLKAKAQAGDAEAQYRLGNAYYNSLGVSRNDELAYKWYLKSADQGFAEAQYTLGLQHSGSKDNPFRLTTVKFDLHEAFKWFFKAGKKGYPKALKQIGEAYKSGLGTEINPELAKEYFKMSVEAFIKKKEKGISFDEKMELADLYEDANLEFGTQNLDEAIVLYKQVFQSIESNTSDEISELSHEKCLIAVASAYRRKEDYSNSIHWYEKAATFGSKAAMNEIVEIYEKLADYKNELKWLLKIDNSIKDDSFTKLKIGRYYHEGKGTEINLSEAYKWYKKAAIIGNEFAQYELSKCYFNGEGVEKNPDEFKKWLLKSAEQDNSLAQYSLGFSYYKGVFFEINYEKAYYWFNKSASQDNSDSQYYMGLCYENGQGVSGNSNTAVSWFRKSAEQGNSEAQFELGMSYLNGLGNSKNEIEAMNWLNKAVQQGNLKAKEILDQIIQNNNQKKLALLIANSKYSQFGALANTDSDAQKLTKVLNSLGFQVTILKNASKEQMLDALKDFEAKVRGTNAIAFFHYGGHGVQVEGKNYLIPADAEIPDERRVSTRAVDLEEVIAVLDSAKPKASVLVVDACRHNPLPASATRSATRGLAVVGRKPKNSVIIYAAEAGNEAFDGLFTPILAENLQEHSDKSLNQIMQKVRAEVFERSKGAQTPGEYNQLFEDLFFSKN